MLTYFTCTWDAQEGKEHPRRPPPFSAPRLAFPAVAVCGEPSGPARSGAPGSLSLLAARAQRLRPRRPCASRPDDARPRSSASWRGPHWTTSEGRALLLHRRNALRGLGPEPRQRPSGPDVAPTPAKDVRPGLRPRRLGAHKDDAPGGPGPPAPVPATSSPPRPSPETRPAPPPAPRHPPW